MEDIFGNSLDVGDTVAFCPPGHRAMMPGTVVKLTSKQVRVEYRLTLNGVPYGKVEEYCSSPNAFIKKK